MKKEPMPSATVTVTCDRCGASFVVVALGTQKLVTLLFLARKQHAKAEHAWKEE